MDIFGRAPRERNDVGFGMRISTIAASGLLLSPASASAQLVFISAEGGVSQEGRGIALRGNGRCHVLAPAHVVNGNETITVWGRGRARSSASVAKAFDSESGASRLDLVILELDAAGKVPCDEAPPGLKQISDALDNPGSALVRRIDAKGTVSNSEALIRSANPTDIALTPGSRPDDALLPGDSGSIVYAASVPVAMLLSREGDGMGRYAAIRLDLAYTLANGYFASQRAPVRAFRFNRLALDQSAISGLSSGRAAAPRLSLGDADLRAETDRLLAGTRGFPQVQNDGAADVSVVGNLALAVVAIEPSVRNSCVQRRNKLLGMPVTTYESRDPTSICHNGFGPVRAFTRLTFRLSGDVREGTGGAVAPILDQFQLVIPAESGQFGLALVSELSNRICARTRIAVEQLTPATKGRSKPSLGTGLFGNSNLIIPNLESPKLRTSC